MGTLFSSAAAVFITLPILFYILIFTLVKQLTRNHRKALNAAIYMTTFVLIASVHFLIMTIWESSYLFIIILFMLVTAVFFTFLHWKTREEIIYRKVFAGYLRLNFLMFSFFYIGLLLFGIIARAKNLIFSV
ncbi:DUF3397 domain-containing protein [Siminovitchia acidinfaciens]|uniref:DUF3397 domain-containing protein n=1 Tax=Siminovitchia acidinfaciens TaxID=2321395 RepID=A0A429Y2W3_9BACI|nr:DUF3397 domain-containing protein [Siminovitchia acidinfaciens]RST75592.1 DUF3397 domain-containing protein [Siminovitchia acidinfaciens]